ncbi:MAG: acyl carrier protein [Butyrivibrio sp.]|nr:acyl carrier protein [Butyrivibrio sp.]
MEREEVFSKLTDIFRDNFDDDTIELSDETSADDIDGWDSMEQVNLLVIIQEKFKITFNINEVNAMKNVGEMADYILQKVNVL